MTDSGPHQPIQAKSFFAVLSEEPWTDVEDRLRSVLGPATIVGVSQDRRVALAVSDRLAGSSVASVSSRGGQIEVVLGDISEFEERQNDRTMANAALVQCDIDRGCLKALASIVGLPPLFLCEGNGWVILTSDLFCLAQLLPSGLTFDLEGVLDLCSYGFPIEGRTLFKNVRLVPGGCSLEIVRGSKPKLSRAWQFPSSDPLEKWSEYTDLQAAAFIAAIKRMNLKDSFLSLTAGLDTRTIFAALISLNRPVPAFTLSGERPSLDARTARALCRAYGIPHEAIALDKQFERNLADYTIEASRLSGGLASLGQSHQVYLYRKLPHPFAGRISGNLGNQLGRKGVEHVTMRAANPTVLNGELQKRLTERPRFAWSHKGETRSQSSHEFLFQEEYPFTQLGNYSIGDSFAVQHSPYADRDLIALCSRQPNRKETAQQMSPLRLRLRDLRHRFLGESEMYSFQRRLINRIGGVAAAYPINWGWQAKGGVSFLGALRGCMTIADAYTERAGWDSGLSGQILRALQITGLHEHRKPKRWLKDSLRDFAYDTLCSQQSNEADLFDMTVVNKMLEEHYSGRVSHHRALVLALDLALAARNFRAKLS